MEQALLDERLELFLKHNGHREQIANMRKEQKAWQDRITEIDRLETIEKLNPDKSLNQGIGGSFDVRAHLGAK